MGLLAPALAAQSRDDDGACGVDYQVPSQVQGRGIHSPLAGRRVTVEGIVTGAFPGADGLSGFYMASAPDETDSDPATSEGLFIHFPSSNAAERKFPALGHRMRMTGKVKEYHGLTELTAISRVADCGPAARSPEPGVLQWPLTHPEHLEGMPVVVDGLRVVDHRELPRYGSLVLAPRRLYTPTQIAEPGAAAEAVARENRAHRIVLDDGSSQVNPKRRYRLYYQRSNADGEPEQEERLLRLGARTGRFQAIVDYRYGDWRLQPIGPVHFEPANPRPLPPGPADGLRFAAFNLENFFNGDGRGGGFPTARGAGSEAEFHRQKARLSSAMRLLNADLIAVAEIENDGYGPGSAAAELADALGPAWRFVYFSDNARGGDAITNGIFYRKDRLQQLGTSASLTTGAFARGNRPPMAATFTSPSEDKAPGAAITVVANHFKSKRCGGASGANADQAEGCWAALRVQAAAALLRWLQTDPTGVDAHGSVLLGDFNSYRREAAMDVLRRAGFVNPAAPETYSYVYQGQLGSLDYTWVSASLAAAISGAGVWHGNVDERRSGGKRAGPWGASDHDPVWVDLGPGIR